MEKKISLLGILLIAGLLIAPTKAKAASSIHSIMPDTAHNWGVVDIVVEGIGFEAGIMLRLSKEDQQDILVNTILVSSSKIKGMIDFRGENPGEYKVVVTNPDGESDTANCYFTLTTPPAPQITSNTPELAENRGIVTVEVTGNNFLHGAQVKLLNDGLPDRDAIYVSVHSSSNITCKFNLTGLEAGQWNLKVINPDGQAAVSNSIDIIEATSAVDCSMIFPDAHLYVDAVNGSNASGDGSLSNPWQTITYALGYIAGCSASPSGITVHVAEGTYDPALGETFPIVMLDGVSLVGAAAATTILDAQNTNGVIYCSNIGDGESIEKLTITNGSGYLGGGIYGSHSSPTITDSTIISNNAYLGGGIYWLYSSPTITNCTINNNTGVNSAGGILLGESSPTITNCIINNNNANSFNGGGIDCVYSSPTITDCTISNNNSDEWGGGIYCYSSSPTITNCTISDNIAGDGGGIMCINSSSPTITNCTISNNSADAGGGISCANSSSATITNCTISNNDADLGAGVFCSLSSAIISSCTINNNLAYSTGGGIYCHSSSATISNCTINNNTAANLGGGVFYSRSSPTITNCTISNNTAWRGGGISCNYSSPTITNCIISNNTITGSYSAGGGISCERYSSPTITNCIISNNTIPGSYSAGGGISCERYSSPTITNCTISSNIIIGSYGAGGGISCEYSSSPTITNCILWDNSPEEIWLGSTSSINITYSDIADAGLGCTPDADGNITCDPMFDVDYRLTAGSPCIDTGIYTSTVMDDIDGDLRPYDGKPGIQSDDGLEFDMGADEYVVDTISELVETLEKLVDTGVIAEELQTSIISKCENAEASADKEDICAAINKLEALINQTNAQRGKKITDEAADFIVINTNDLITQLENQLPPGDSC